MWGNGTEYTKWLFREELQVAAGDGGGVEKGACLSGTRLLRVMSEGKGGRMASEGSLFGFGHAQMGTNPATHQPIQDGSAHSGSAPEQVSTGSPPASVSPAHFTPPKSSSTIRHYLMIDAGFGLPGTVEDIPLNEARYQFEVRPRHSAQALEVWLSGVRVTPRFPTSLSCELSN